MLRLPSDGVQNFLRHTEVCDFVGSMIISLLMNINLGHLGGASILRMFTTTRPHGSVNTTTSLADLGGREGRTPPPWASKFFRFHAVFGKIWRVQAPPGGFTPPLGKILDPPLHMARYFPIFLVFGAKFQYFDNGE